MPTTYAHWRFGKDCIDTLPKEIQKIVNNNIDIYNLGVHGPDIFFYDLMHKKTVQYGKKEHITPAEVFFYNGKKVYRNHFEKNEILTYMLGFLSHFVLDSTAHGYIEHKKEVSGISHNKIEAEWDKHVIELDNREPNLVDRSESLRPNKYNSKIISYFYTLNARTIFRTCKSQHFLVHFMNCISPKKYNIATKILKKLRLDNMADLLIPFEKNSITDDSNLRLDKLRNKSLTLYKKLSINLLNYLNNKERLDKYFDRDLSYTEDYKDIPILPYIKEQTFKI